MELSRMPVMTSPVVSPIGKAKADAPPNNVRGAVDAVSLGTSHTGSIINRQTLEALTKRHSAEETGSTGAINSSSAGKVTETYLPLPHNLQSDTAFSRVNIPWFNFGVDFGATVWGDLGIAHNEMVAPILSQIRSLGVEDVIMWVSPDGRNIRFDANGTPTGLAEGFERDLSTFMDLLSERGMSSELVLIDGNTWCYPEVTSGGLKFQGHGDVISDPTGRKQKAFDECVLAPILNTISDWKAGHPEAPLPISGINLGNELRYGVDKDPDHPSKNVSSMRQMQRFVRGRAAFVHKNLPGVPVTTGAVTPRDLFKYWIDGKLSGAPKRQLDYYTFHDYTTDSIKEIAKKYPWGSLKKRVHMGEFPGNPIPNGPKDALEYLKAVSGMRGDTHRPWTPERPFKSAAMWAATTVDAITPSNPQGAMEKIQSWYSSEFVATQGEDAWRT